MITTTTTATPYLTFVGVVSADRESKTLLLSMNLSVRNCLPTGEVFLAGRTMGLLDSWSKTLHPPVVDTAGKIIGYLAEPITVEDYCKCSIRVRFTDDDAWLRHSDLNTRAYIRGGLWGDEILRTSLKGRTSVVVRPTELVLWRGHSNRKRKS